MVDVHIGAIVRGMAHAILCLCGDGAQRANHLLTILRWDLLAMGKHMDNVHHQDLGFDDDEDLQGHLLLLLQPRRRWLLQWLVAASNVEHTRSASIIQQCNTNENIIISLNDK
mmetsp:Transcript_1422/g.2029  ORF Transcript_1422/g.2029 Transcript_1422/m.2029 type:complete len:113 (-) Transcript_1422:125-463(-)